MMEMAIKLLFYLGAAAFLLGANLWLVRSFVDSFGEPNAVAPFQLIGRADADEKLGDALAHMLVARFGTIKQEIEVLQRGLRANEGQSQPVVHPIAGTDGVVPAVEIVLDVRSSPSWPNDVFKPLNLNLTVGGVELGGILAWLHQSLAEPRTINISVEYHSDAATATVFGNVSAAGGSTLYLEAVSATNEEIVTTAAYAIAQRQVGRGIPEVEALEPTEFRTLLAALRKTAEINRRVALGREVGGGYGEVLKDISKLTEVMDEWPMLIRFAADLSFSAKEYGKALAYYERLYKLVPASDGGRQQIAARIEELKPIVASVKLAAARPTAPTISGKSDAIYDEILKSPLAKSTLQLVGVKSREMDQGPLVAVLGGIPPSWITNDEHMIVVGNADDSRDPVMSEYVGTVIQTVRLIAPKSRFVFSSRPISDIANLVPAINEIVNAQEQPDILLITFGPLSGQNFEDAFSQVADQGIAVVLAAGNRPDEPIPLATSKIFDKLLVVAAVTQDGQAADFTSRGDSVLWAPGVNIPVVTLTGQQPELTVRSGTTYSAAIAAGIVARVLAEHPELDPPSLIDVLRSTSKAVDPTGPMILNLEAALEDLRS